MTRNITAILVSTLFLLLLGVFLLQGQDIRLEYKYKEGAVDRYKETMQNETTAEMMPGGGQTIFNEMYSTQKVDKVKADGSAEVIRTIDSVNTLLNGQPFSIPQTKALVGVPVRMVITKTGKILSVEPVKELTDATAKQFFQEFKNNLMANSGFPAKTIKMKESWKDSAKTSRETQVGTLTMNMKFSTTYVGTDTVSGFIVRVLQRVSETSGEMGAGAGTLTGTGKGNIYFSEILGKEIKTVMSTDQNMDMTTPQGSFSMNIKVSTTKELIK